MGILTRVQATGSNSTHGYSAFWFVGGCHWEIGDLPDIGCHWRQVNFLSDYCFIQIPRNDWMVFRDFVWLCMTEVFPLRWISFAASSVLLFQTPSISITNAPWAFVCTPMERTHWHSACMERTHWHSKVYISYIALYTYIYIYIYIEMDSYTHIGSVPFPGPMGTGKYYRDMIFTYIYIYTYPYNFCKHCLRQQCTFIFISPVKTRKLAVISLIYKPFSCIFHVYNIKYW